MKGSDKAVVLGVLMAVVLVGFYLIVLAPKRDKAGQLGKDVNGLKAEVAQQEQTAQYGEEARSHFPAYYGRLVVLGKAVPDSADTPSLLVQLNHVAAHSHVEFDGISLNASGTSGTATPAPTPPPSSGGSSGTSTTPAPSGGSTSGTSSSSTATPASSTTPTSAPATEASAASLPIGATVGPDNLAVMPYNLSFSGTYFNVADFLKGLDELIQTKGNSSVAADGRLLTIDGFSLASPSVNPADPTLKVSVAVTSFVTPASEGLTGGATPSGPSSVGTTPTQPASATVAAP